LGKAGLKPESIAATATVVLEMLPTGPTVTESHLDVTVKVPGAPSDKVLAVANTAKAGCPISRLLNAKVTMDAKVEA
jgi:lipoyl-dependent peroxiredoxin